MSLLSAVGRSLGVEPKGLKTPVQVCHLVRQEAELGSDPYSLAREVQGVGSRATPDAWVPGTAPLPPTSFWLPQQNWAERHDL